ncbi:exopolysaccharide biosynthesis polyprenyl glycosylphosphotransferase [Hephaestia sp. GCM10023244]|uniref:exopolysaccharide biosynthesis polyprenyl glycosylphosphotransferase n=1 Tax=unclassified Hephaestia TaxID=2631281 RepID=UPI0020779815|nr:exopolysaccharide biosynthesis polyprenyl glycosylphosphotransferase [Hephaestia sp. MAHUQ-44]MCM8731999.1 exopolysaccharide biosynthesis polyprenyl glycosylphosphotransferase [Hephaestia sp. MAHUQ-44]
MFTYLILLDVACILAGYGLVPLLNDIPYSDNRLQLVIAALLPVYLFTAANAGAYSPELIQHRLRAIRLAVQAMALAVGFLLLVAFALKTSAQFSRFAFFVGAVVSVALLAASRYWFMKHATRIIGGNPFGVVLLVDGDRPLPRGDYAAQISTEGYFDPDGDDPDMYDRLAQVLDGANRVVVACDPSRRLSWANALRGANIQGEIVAPELDQLVPLGIGRQGGRATVIVSTGPLGLFDRAVKRAFDVAVAAVVLILLSPLLLLIAIAIKLDSPGPLLFRQVRIGRANKMFEMLKFRSMRADNCDALGDQSTQRGDTRITRVGAIIRKTSIDELPQLFNVLKGDMSVVGPRPHALGSRAADKLFWEIDSRYWSRHAIKPGLTGLAQVRGYRGATHHEDDLLNRLHSDLEYLDHWSIWRDIKIILQTFRVLFHRNAY